MKTGVKTGKARGPPKRENIGRARRARAVGRARRARAEVKAHREGMRLYDGAEVSLVSLGSVPLAETRRLGLGLLGLLLQCAEGKGKGEEEARRGQQESRGGERR